MAQTKQELLDEARKVGAPVDDSNTVQEIQAAVQKAKDEDAEDQRHTETQRKAALSQSHAAAKPEKKDIDDEAKQKQQLREAAATTPGVSHPAANDTGLAQGPTGNIYELGHSEAQPDVAEIKAVEELKLEDLPRSLLQQLQGAVAGVLSKKGSEPHRPVGPDLNIIVGTYPVNSDAVGGLSLGQAAKKLDLKEDEIAAYTVRQQRGPDGGFVGDAYVRAVTHNGKKLTVLA